MPTGPEPWPSELRVQNNGRTLKVTFEDGVCGAVASERLRNAGEKPAGPAPPDVAITDSVQIGTFAVRIGFDDGRAADIYTWRQLRALTTQ